MKGAKVEEAVPSAHRFRKDVVFLPAALGECYVGRKIDQVAEVVHAGHIGVDALSDPGLVPNKPLVEQYTHRFIFACACDYLPFKLDPGPFEVHSRRSDPPDPELWILSLGVDFKWPRI